MTKVNLSEALKRLVAERAGVPIDKLEVVARRATFGFDAEVFELSDGRTITITKYEIVNLEADIDTLIDRSSLGSVTAKRLRSRTPENIASRIIDIASVEEKQVELNPPNFTCPDCRFMTELEGKFYRYEGRIVWVSEPDPQPRRGPTEHVCLEGESCGDFKPLDLPVISTNTLLWEVI